MNKKTKFLCVLALTSSLFSLASCGGDSSSSVAKTEIEQIYEVYAENGGTLSYQEWLATIKGEKGDKGDKGDKGEDGKDGVDGTNGKDGVDGKDGAQGEKGDKGDKGDSGEDGTSLLTGTGAPDNSLGKLSDSYIDTTTFDFYIKGESGWIKAGNIKGTDGKDGASAAQGEKGDKGDKGDKGEDGKDGVDGTNGKDGVDGKDGTDGKDGAQGDKGDKGDTGETGRGIEKVETETREIDGTAYLVFTYYYTDGTTSESNIILSTKTVAHLELLDSNVTIGTSLESLVVRVYYSDGSSTEVNLTKDMVLNIEKVDLSTAGNYDLELSYNGFTCRATINVYDPTSVTVTNVYLDRNYVMEYNEETGEIQNLDNYTAIVEYSNGTSDELPLSKFDSIKVAKFAANEVCEIVVYLDGKEYNLSAYLVTSLSDVTYDRVETYEELRIMVGETFDSYSYYAYAVTAEGYCSKVLLTSSNVFELDEKTSETSYVTLDTSTAEGKVGYLKINEQYLQLKLEIVDKSSIKVDSLSMDSFYVDVQDTKEETLLKVKEAILNSKLRVRYSDGTENYVSISEDMIVIDDSFENVAGKEVKFSITYDSYTENLFTYLRPDFDNATSLGTYTIEDPYMKLFTGENNAWTLYNNDFALGEDGSTYCKYIKEDNVIKMYPDGSDDNNYLLFNLDEDNKLITTYTPDEDKLVSSYKNASEYDEKDFNTSYRKLNLYNDGKVVLTLYYPDTKETYLIVYETSYVKDMTTIELTDFPSYIFSLDNENKTFVIEHK